MFTAASAYRRDGGSSSGANGSAGVLGEDLPDYEGSGDETDSDHELASPRSTAARVAQSEAKALDTTAKLQQLMAQRDGVMNGTAPATAASGQGGAGETAGGGGRAEAKSGSSRDDGRDWDSDMDVATEDLQESFPPPRRSKRQSVAQKPSSSTPGKPPSVSPVAPPPTPRASQPAPKEMVVGPEGGTTGANAVATAAVPQPYSTGVKHVGELAVAPPLPPSDDPSQPLADTTPSSPYPPVPSMTAAVASTQPPPPGPPTPQLPVPAAAPPPPPPPSSLLLPPPPPPPLPSLGPGKKSAGVAGRTSGESNAEIEFIPLGRSPRARGGKVSPGTGRAAVGTGAKVAGTGRKSFLFSDEEQKALGSASRGAGKAKGKSKAIPAARPKIKGKKLATAAVKPKVAGVFTDEGQAAATRKVCTASTAGGWCAVGMSMLLTLFLRAPYMDAFDARQRMGEVLARVSSFRRLERRT